MTSSKADYVKEITVIDPDTKLEVEVCLFKDQESGGMFGVDSSFIATLDERDLVNNPFNGNQIQLIG